MMRRSVSILLLAAWITISGSLAVYGQADTERRVSTPHPPLVYRSDTLPVMQIPELKIYDVSKYNYLKSRRYRRMIHNVRKAYPYAMVANERLKILDKELSKIKSKREQKAYMNEAEKEIMQEFEGELRKLTISQGIILVKLIDREIGHTSYEVIKDIRGGFTAFFWQGIARIFGNNLKMQYDPDGEDKVIEDIIMAMEYGYI